MSNALVRAGSFYSTPAVPYQPARPAYTWYETRTGVRVQVGGSSWIRVPITEYTDGPVIGYQLFYTGHGDGTNLVSGTYVVAHHVPATPEIPGSPAVRTDVPPAGWNSFGHTIAAMQRYGEATFEVMESVAGAAVGLTADAAPTNGYTYMPHALVFNQGKVYAAKTGSLLGTYIAGDVFKIKSSGGTVSYLKNADLLTTEAEAFAPASRVMLSAALYRAGDFVSDPTVTDMPEGNAALVEPAMAMLAADFDYAGAAMVEPPMQLLAYVDDLTFMTEPAMAMFATDLIGYAEAVLVEPKMKLSATDVTDTVIIDPGNYAEMAEPPMAMAALMLSGGIGEAEMTEPAMRMLGADYNYAEAVLVEPPMVMVAFEEPDFIGYILELVEVRFDLIAAGADQVEMPWPAVFGFDLAASLAQIAEMPWPTVVSFDFSTTSAETALMPWPVVADFPLTVPSQDIDVWAVNLATNGSTSYAGFVFNSFANIGGRYFGANAAGIFELDGDDDAGVPIDAAISLGAKDFGSAQKKTLVECFVTMAGTAPLFMKLRAEGNEFVYQTQSYSDELQLQRFKFGKGKALQANYLTPIIYNVDGKDFELEGIQFAVADLQRKL